MPRSREISAELRKKVVEAHEAGKGYKTISKVFELHHSTVRKIIYKWKLFNTTDTRPRSGRPTKLQTILREIRKSGAGNQKGRIITEDNSGGRDGGEEALCISDNEDETEDGGVVRGSSEGEEAVLISDSENETEDGGVVRRSSEGEAAVLISGTDTSPGCGNLPGHVGAEDGDLPSMKLVLPNDPAGTRRTPKPTKGRKEKMQKLVLMRTRILASPPTHSSIQAPVTPDAPTTSPAKYHIKVMLCCEICGACFPTETDLESHQAQHLDKILHECEECGKACKSAAGLTKHKKRKHGGCAGEMRPNSAPGGDLKCAGENDAPNHPAP